MLSHHAHFVKLNNGRYAVFNNMVMDVIYVDENEKNQIVDHTVTNQETIDLLLDKGIYVRNNSSDEKALKILRDAYSETVGRIQILYLILTNSCNLNCTYCFLENNTQYKEQRSIMSEDTAFVAVEKFCAYVNQNKIEYPLIILYGGEPLLNVEVIKAVVNYAKKYVEGMQFSLITNGTLITDEICAFLKAYNVNIGISIDGVKKIHDNNRPFKKDGKGSFDAANQGRRLLDQNGINYGLSMTVSPDFLNCQDEVIEWLSSENVNNIFYNLYHFSSPDDSWEEVAKKTVEYLIKSYDTFSSSPLAEGRVQRQIDSIIKTKFIFSDCGAVGCEQFVVMPNGDISICHGDSNTGNHIVGNIHSIDISSIINTVEGFEWTRRATLYNDECLLCEALFCCGGGCKLQAQNLFGNREAIDRFHCVYIKGILKWMLEKIANNS